MRINQTHVAGEPLSIFQLGERVRKQTVISQIRTNEDESIVEPQAIEAKLFNFLSNLYSEEGTGNNGADFVCECVIPPNDPLNETCTSENLKTRLEHVLRAHHVLSDGQKCWNSERNICQATLALKDRIANLRHHRRARKLISFDLENTLSSSKPCTQPAAHRSSFSHCKSIHLSTAVQRASLAPV